MDNSLNYSYFVVSKEDNIKFLTKEELSLFLTTVEKIGLDFDACYFTLLAYSGIRGGEESALQWIDVNFEESFININKTISTKGNRTQYYELNTPKTSIRKIILAENVMILLRKTKLLQNKRKLSYPDSYHDGNFVFAGTDGYPKPLGFSNKDYYGYKKI